MGLKLLGSKVRVRRRPVRARGFCGCICLLNLPAGRELEVLDLFASAIE